MRKVFLFLKIVGFFGGVLFMFGFGIGTGAVIPENVIVFGDPNSSEYFAPPCIMESGFNDKILLVAFAIDHGLEFGTFKDIRSRGFKPHSRCRDIGGFYEEKRSLSGSLLEKLGVLPEFNSRWNPNGTWNR